MDEQTDMDENTDQIKKVMHQIISAAIKHRKLMDYYLVETGIFSSQQQILMELSRKQFSSQKEIADRMNVSSAAIAVSLKKLERGGYISKEMDDADNRLNQITLTDKGCNVVEQSRQIFKNLNRRVFEDFKEDELEELSKLLCKLNSKLNEIDSSIKAN